mgnify:CR=1 FL=1
MFPEDDGDINSLIKKGDALYINDHELRNAIIFILLRVPDTESKLNILTLIGLSSNDNTFALCERIREMII